MRSDSAVQHAFSRMQFAAPSQTGSFSETPTGCQPCFFKSTRAIDESTPPDMPTTSFLPAMLPYLLPEKYI